MTSIEYAKKNKIYIYGNRSIIKSCEARPTFIASLRFFIEPLGYDFKQIRTSDISDYEELAKEIFIITPEGKKEEVLSKNSIKEKEEKRAMNEMIEANVDVIKVSETPNISACKPEEIIYRILLFDGKVHYVYETKSKDHPNAGDKRLLKAKIKEKSEERIDMDIPLYYISNVKLLVPKKAK